MSHVHARLRLLLMLAPPTRHTPGHAASWHTQWNEALRELTPAERHDYQQLIDVPKRVLGQHPLALVFTAAVVGLTWALNLNGAVLLAVMASGVALLPSLSHAIDTPRRRAARRLRLEFHRGAIVFPRMNDLATSPRLRLPAHPTLV